MTGKYWTIKDLAAAYTRDTGPLQERAIRRWLREGLLKGEKFGRDWRIADRDWTAFVAIKGGIKPKDD